MPTTSNFGWTTPADTDLVKDGAAAIRTLGNGIDTSFLDLKGGTTGQVLSKASNTDLDFTWTAGGDITEVQAGVGISVASGTGPIPVITNSSTDLITTAGDLLYGTAADTVARLGIGTAGQVLKVNSGATAPEWGAAPSPSFAGAVAVKNTNQTLATGTATLVTFEYEDIDVGGYFTTGANTKMTIPSGKGGKYLIVVQLMYANSATSNTSRESRLRVNGATSKHQTYTVGMNMTRPQCVYSVDVLDLAAGDYVEVQGYQDSGGNLNIVGDTSYDYSYFSVTYLGA